MSGKFASCAANVRPAGPQPMIKTSTSLGRPSELDDMLCRSDGSEISGFPGLNPLRWNCIGELPHLRYLLREETISYQPRAAAPGLLLWRSQRSLKAGVGGTWEAWPLNSWV